MSSLREFDYEEAAHLRGFDLTFEEVGAWLGVTGESIRRALMPPQERRKQNRKNNLRKKTPCLGCGELSWGTRCRSCAAQHQIGRLPTNKVSYEPGERFGHLMVMYEEGRDRHGEVKVRVLCDCGRTKLVIGRNMRRGFTTTCGCFAQWRTS